MEPFCLGGCPIKGLKLEVYGRLCEKERGSKRKLTMKTFPPHKSAGKKTLATHSKVKSGAGGHNSGGHFNAKLHRHTQNHRLKGAKSIKPPLPLSASSHRREVPCTGVPSLANGGAAPEDSNGTSVEKEKEDTRNEYDLFLQVSFRNFVPLFGL